MSLQARIQQFESLSRNGGGKTTSVSPKVSPVNTSFSPSKNVFEASSPTSDSTLMSYPSLEPTPSPSPSPQTSVVDLSDWVITEKRPSLPPRKVSATSLAAPPLNLAANASHKGHASANSASSFHSVSLSSDGGKSEPTTITTGNSSFETASTSATSISSSDAGQSMPAKPRLPPRKPNLPLPPHTVGASPPQLSLRKVPPPPPIGVARQTSDSSLRSQASTLSSTPSAAAVSQPTPVPPVARKRYETLFAANMSKQRALLASASLMPTPTTPTPRRTRDGWRGLSVDLIELPEAENRPQATVSLSTKETLTTNLHGAFVRLIWERSRLDHTVLRKIWQDVCPVENKGSSASLSVLDIDSFVRGMWLIDEELRRRAAAPSTHHKQRSPVPRSSSRAAPPPPPLRPLYASKAFLDSLPR